MYWPFWLAFALLMVVALGRDVKFGMSTATSTAHTRDRKRSYQGVPDPRLARYLVLAATVRRRKR